MAGRTEAARRETARRPHAAPGPLGAAWKGGTAGSRSPGATPGAAGLTLALALALTAGCGDRQDFLPPYTALPDAPRVSPDDFTGAEACGACHADTYQRWAGSTHGRAGVAPPAPDLLLAPFDGTPIRFADATVVPGRLPDGAYAFVVDWSRGTDTLRVDGVVGGGHMVGGGTQGFFSLLADGTQRFVPFDWSRHAEAWFCNTRWPNRGEWRRISPEMRLTECADWPPRRMLGQVEGRTNCDTCHGSQILTELDPASGRYRTSFTGLDVNCESCHGPGRAHVERMQEGGPLTDGDLALPSLGTLDEDGSLATCFRCHATRLVLHPGDLPGERLDANYSLLLPALTDRPFLPDNRVRTFGYQLNHLGSGCYLDGSMTCVSCHEPHGQSYQDEHVRPLPDRFDDGQCTSCHASKALDPRAHTRHPPESDGARCVSCHMPYLQHPSLGNDVPYARSDHTIPVPRPGLDEQLGITSACAGCHPDRTPDDLARQVTAWYGELKPWRDGVQALARSGAVRDPAEGARLLLRPGEAFAMTQAQGLGQFMVRFLEPDMELPADALERLRDLTRDPDLDVRALAAATLHLAAGTEPEARRALSEAVSAMGGEQALLRDRWAAALRYMGDLYRMSRRPAAAVTTLERALDVVPDEPRSLSGLGLALLAAGDPEGAEAAFRASAEGDPTRSEPLLGLAQAMGAQGRADEEMALREEAATRFPMDPRTHFQLGNARLARRDFLGAEDAFRQALELDRGLAAPRLGLAQVLAASGRTDEALAQVRLAGEFEPANPQVRQLLERLQRP